jgi:hypothetical protein
MCGGSDYRSGDKKRHQQNNANANCPKGDFKDL